MNINFAVVISDLVYVINQMENNIILNVYNAIQNAIQCYFLLKFNHEVLIDHVNVLKMHSLPAMCQKISFL
jgi:hypothetical protein